MRAMHAAADRSRWFAIACVALSLNGAMTLAIVAIQAEGWLAATLNLFGVSAILWVAGAAATTLAWQAPPVPAPDRVDTALLVMATIVLLLPVPAFSAFAMSALCLWTIATTSSGAPLRRAALIFLSITTSLLWGRLLLAFGSGPLLASEGRMAGWIAGTGGAANVVDFADGTYFLVAPGCSSLQGVSLTIVLWVTVTQYFALPLTRRVWLTLFAAIAATIAINLLRLAAIARFPVHFDSLHVGIGATIFGWATLAAVMGVMWSGLRGALLQRA